MACSGHVKGPGITGAECPSSNSALWVLSKTPADASCLIAEAFRLQRSVPQGLPALLLSGLGFPTVSKGPLPTNMLSIHGDLYIFCLPVFLICKVGVITILPSQVESQSTVEKNKT